MTTVKLLNNLPIENLTPETDYLGLIDKGELIKTFLIGNKDQFNEIKMFSLYGEWGSGKSSLMKYMQKELQNDFNTFFFEAWEFEKDENLAMSLLEFITAKNTDAGEAICNDVLKYGGRILRGLGKSIKFNIAGVEVEPSALVGELAKEEELTFYKALEKFKTEFKRLEDNITRKDKKYNMVFIDDLDRCEPEQVLNLLSAIKLFFTYGEKTIFFCGIDKKAVEEAVKTKYGEIVKSNEYLEKIFDISFTMPKHSSIIKLINQYFDDTIYILKDDRLPINERVNQFFEILNFTNPRRIKKVLNKFQILRSLKHNWTDRDGIFPNIDEYNSEQASLFETLLTLYLIILYEFHSILFNDFLNLNKKSETFIKVDLSHFIKSMLENEMSDMPFHKFSNYSEILTNNKFMTIVCPSNISKAINTKGYSANNLSSYKLFVSHDKIENLFYEFICEKINIFTYDRNMSESSFKSIKDLVRNSM